MLRPLGVGEILDVSLKLTWRNLGTLMRIVLCVVAPAQLLIAVVDVSALPGFRPGATFFNSAGETGVTVDGHAFWTLLAAFLVALLIGFLSNAFATGACFRAIAQSYLGLPCGWRASLGFAARRFLSILWIALLGFVLTAIGAVFCLVPGIYLAVAFTVALPVLMSEGQRGSKALGRSRALVRGRWWKTALTILVATLLVSVVSGVVSGLVAAVSLSGGGGPVVRLVVATVGGVAAALFTTPFSAAYHTVIYFDLRVRKEAFDLRLLASRIGVEPPEGWEPPPPQPASAAAPPFWPPPPDWTPGAPAAPTPPSGQPPFWPPPPGWSPAGAAGVEEQRPPGQPHFWPPPPGWTPGDE